MVENAHAAFELIVIKTQSTLMLYTSNKLKIYILLLLPVSLNKGIFNTINLSIVCISDVVGTLHY